MNGAEPEARTPGDGPAVHSGGGSGPVSVPSHVPRAPSHRRSRSSGGSETGTEG